MATLIQEESFLEESSSRKYVSGLNVDAESTWLIK